MQGLVWAVAAAVIAAPALAFDLSPGDRLSVEGHELGVHAIAFDVATDEPARLDVDLDMLPFGTELDGAVADRVTAALCKRIGAGGRLEVLGMPVEEIRITLYLVEVDGNSTSRSGMPLHC